MNCCNVGALAKLAIGGTRMDFIEFSPERFIKVLSDGSVRAIRGRLDHSSDAVGEGMLFVQFRISMYMSALKNDVLLPIMGLAESPTDTFTLGDTLSPTNIILGPSGSKEQVYTDCYCGRWMVAGQKGTDPVRLDLWFTAKTWSEQDPLTFFTGANTPVLNEGYYYSFTNGSMNLLGAARYFNQFRMVMDYGLISEFNNSITATNICPTDHRLQIGTGVLYSTCDSNTDLFTVPMGGDVSGSAFTLNFDRADVSKSTHFSVGNVKLIARPPRVVKNDFLRLPVNGEGFALGTSPMLICVNSA